jgi:hypothetical protein
MCLVRWFPTDHLAGFDPEWLDLKCGVVGFEFVPILIFCEGTISGHRSITSGRSEIIAPGTGSRLSVQTTIWPCLQIGRILPLRQSLRSAFGLSHPKILLSARTGKVVVKTTAAIKMVKEHHGCSRNKIMPNK